MVFPEYQVHRHSGKRFKKQISSPSETLGEEVSKKKEISSPSVALREE
jgi:hypothetical protein